MKVNVTTDNIKLFKCLSSKTRIKIIQLLNETSKNIGELAKTIGVSSAIITRHIASLEECGIIKTKNSPGKRGLQKICTLSLKEATLVFQTTIPPTNDSQKVSIPLGQYTDYKIQATCGLASTKGLIGVCDDPRYFSSPDRFNASIIWFQSGWINYRIPGYLISEKPVENIELSLEICSEFPGYKEDWSSDIYFFLNEKLLGCWQSPGDFGDRKGSYTPEWWNLGTQYGLLKTIQISHSKTMLDGIKLSDMTLDQLSLQRGKDLYFRIAAPNDTKHPGGATLFGKGFGNYNQNISVQINYQ